MSFILLPIANILCHDDYLQHQSQSTTSFGFFVSKNVRSFYGFGVACFKWCGQKVDDPYKLRAGMLLIFFSRLSAFDRTLNEVEELLLCPTLTIHAKAVYELLQIFENFDPDFIICREEYLNGGLYTSAAWMDTMQCYL